MSAASGCVHVLQAEAQRTKWMVDMLMTIDSEHQKVLEQQAAELVSAQHAQPLLRQVKIHPTLHRTLLNSLLTCSLVTPVWVST